MIKIRQEYCSPVGSSSHSYVEKTCSYLIPPAPSLIEAADPESSATALKMLGVVLVVGIPTMAAGLGVGFGMINAESDEHPWPLGGWAPFLGGLGAMVGTAIVMAAGLKAASICRKCLRGGYEPV